jgi:hypothetical protein
MKKIISIFFTLILFASFIACEKDEPNVVMESNPTAPTIESLPDLTLLRAHGADTLIFKGTAVNPGFVASANYYLEACATGNNFKDSIFILKDVQDTAIKITVGDLNEILKKSFPSDAVSTIDFRIRSVMVVVAGSGQPGTGTDLFEYISETKTAEVTLYGLPRLDLIGSGITQKIESALGDGKYTGFVKLDASMPFTLTNPDTNTNYGLNGSTFAVDGTTGLSVATSGWYRLTVDINALTYTIDKYMIGLVGSATPNGWNSPDQKMDYDSQTGTWNITITLITGEFKFRLNDGWAWNLGYNTAHDGLVHNGANIPVTAGNYTISLTITKPNAPEEGTFTITANE